MDEQILEQAATLVGSNNFSEAKKILEDFLSEEKESVEAHKLLGLCNVNMN